jgi:hypothetical protein
MHQEKMDVSLFRAKLVWCTYSEAASTTMKPVLRPGSCFGSVCHLYIQNVLIGARGIVVG